jgi:hypothetical protein
VLSLDPKAILSRFRVDPRVTQRSEIDRLRTLGVGIHELARDRTWQLYERFVREFVEPERGDRLLAERFRAGAPDAILDFERWMRPDCLERVRGRGCLDWLVPRGARCVRLERRARLPALDIVVIGMDDEWAASWPGLFVNFEAGRAFVVTVDYEEIRCDLRGRRTSPYR